eukprot:868860-Amphidinium_carterae.1
MITLPTLKVHACAITLESDPHQSRPLTCTRLQKRTWTSLPGAELATIALHAVLLELLTGDILGFKATWEWTGASNR